MFIFGFIHFKSCWHAYMKGFLKPLYRRGNNLFFKTSILIIKQNYKFISTFFCDLVLNFENSLWLYLAAIATMHAYRSNRDIFLNSYESFTSEEN